MNMPRRKTMAAAQRAAVSAGALFLAASFFAAQPTAAQTNQSASVCQPAVLGSPYIPVDSWIYPAMWRLYAMGYVDDVFLGLRPWTRASVANMLERAEPRIDDATTYGLATADQAKEIYDAINHQLFPDVSGPCRAAEGGVRLESTYSLLRPITGTPLHDSYHLGSSIINDYGRPFESGFNNYTGASGYATAGRFTVYARGEFQGAPSAAGYSLSLAQTLSNIDLITFINPATGMPFPQATIPLGPIPTVTQGRFLEAYVSGQVANHVISFGKSDEWLSPDQGGAMAWSNNAQNIYAFQIDRVEPLNIPLLSRITGPFRYEFLIGSLRGHTLIPNPLYHDNPAAQGNVNTPGDPWVHMEKVSFRPTRNLELGFERTVIFGGEGHSPVTLHTFLKSFFSTQNVTATVKNSSEDPGARFGAFDFSYRLPFVRNWLTLYSDSEAHDDVSPISAPRRAAIRPGLYLSHVPGLQRLDLRAEAVSTDPSVSPSIHGSFMYWEGIEKQGYTNQGQLFGDWIGREDKGGQGWATWHLSGSEWLQVYVRNQKAAKDFIPGGTTLNEIDFQAVKRLKPDLELNANFAYQRWRAPIYLPGTQTVTITNIQLTWYPERKVSF